MIVNAKTFVAMVVIALLTCVTQGSFAQDDTVKISVSGSDTMNLLTQRLAEEYMKAHPNVEISVRGGGSGVGIRDLITGQVALAQASRKMKPEEVQQAKDNGYEPEEHIVALDGIALAVNADSPVKELSQGQIKAIYTGAVQRWNQFNPAWPDERIVVFSRESSSGTYHFFKEKVLDKADFTSNTSYLAATAAVANSVKNDKNAIGFGGVAYFVRTEGIRVLAVKKDKDAPAVTPVETVDGEIHVNLSVIQDGSYSISRPLQYYTREKATGEIGAFLEWIKSDEGQKIVQKMEYIPLGKE